MKYTPAHREDGTCSACAVFVIQGIRCHETGCPEAWREIERPCFQCGCFFQPTQSRVDQTCPECLADQAQAEDPPDPLDEDTDQTNPVTYTERHDWNRHDFDADPDWR